MKNKSFNTRVIVLHYDSTNVPIFKTAEERHDWERALGRLVTYGLQGEGEDGTQLVNMTFGMDPTEIQAAYYPPVPVPRDEEGFAVYRGSPDQAVDALRERLREGSGRPFVIGAVLHEDREWGFHS